MPKNRFFRRLFLPNLLLVCVAIAAVGVFAAVRLRASYLDSTRHALHDQIELLTPLVAPNVDRLPQLQEQVQRLAPAIGSRITIIRADDKGTVIADSEYDPKEMVPHRTASRPEVVGAFASGEGSDIRTSETLSQPMLYLGRRMELGGQPYIIRAAVHLTELNRHLAALYTALAAAAVVAMAAAGLIAFYIARRHSSPVVELAKMAGQLSSSESAGGDLDAIASTLTNMADSLDRLTTQTKATQAELATVVASMSDGVISTDSRQKIVLLNAAAGRMLGFAAEGAEGKMLWEVVRHDQLLKTVGDVLAGSPQHSFQIGPLAGRFLEVTISPLPSRGGIVMVVHDTTQSVRYQELRKEFVANVSHELRTPLTVIKGYVETLLDGAGADPARATTYLATIARHTNQLSNLVADLLQLSRLDGTTGLPDRTLVDIPAALARAAELHLPAAGQKKQTLAISAAPGISPVAGNADYLERAIANLIDNAVKYTPEGGRITATARQENGEVVVEVADTGIGIPEPDLPRIFERFYRVDRSRSREMGGTGLGLSIVKHIAAVHGGKVEVKSTPGAGSVFTLRLPVATETE